MPEPQDPNAEHAQAAAEIEADVGVEHIADVYAKALLAAGENAGQTPQLLAEFDLVVVGILGRYPELQEILASALISHEEKVGILDRVFGPQASPMLMHFLKVVSRRGRLDCLRAIHNQAHELYDRMQGRIDVRLTTATPLGSALAGRIAENLRSLLGGQPVLTRVTDPELIGGAVLRVGDTVYDGSIANQLKTIRQQIIDRSAHEIQSRRDRFRDPAGN